MVIRNGIATSVLLAAGSLMAMRAGEPPIARKSPFDDTKLAVAVKAAFAADPTLAKSNLFVSVLDGVVAVQGPVGDAADVDRIKTLTRSLTGVSGVKVDCHVLSGTDPLTKAISERLNPSSVKPVEPVRTTPVGMPSIAMGPVRSPSDDVVTNRPTDFPSSVTLPPPPATDRPYPTIPSPGVPVAPSLPVGTTVSRNDRPTVTVSNDDIAFALVDLRASDAKFKGLTATVVDGIVTVSGSGDKTSFIAKVKAIPGVVSAR